MFRTYVVAKGRFRPYGGDRWFPYLYQYTDGMVLADGLYGEKVDDSVCILELEEILEKSRGWWYQLPVKLPLGVTLPVFTKDILEFVDIENVREMTWDEVNFRFRHKLFPY